MSCQMITLGVIYFLGNEIKVISALTIKIRRNAYRVLLTRGRDGLCIFVPKEPIIEMNSTYNALLTAGALPIPR